MVQEIKTIISIVAYKFSVATRGCFSNLCYFVTALNYTVAL